MNSVKTYLSVLCLFCMASVSTAELTRKGKASSINPAVYEELVYSSLQSFSVAMDHIYISIFSSDGKSGDELLADLSLIGSPYNYLNMMWDEDGISIPPSKKETFEEIMISLNAAHIMLNAILFAVDEKHQTDAKDQYTISKEAADVMLKELQVASKARWESLF